jgi:uncharacterized protein Veg
MDDKWSNKNSITAKKESWLLIRSQGGRKKKKESKKETQSTTKVRNLLLTY